MPPPKYLSPRERLLPKAAARPARQPQPAKPPPPPPPAYRPQQPPKCLQAKPALVRQPPPFAGPPPSAQTRKAPAAPPVYRPQPAPVLMQRKEAVIRPPHGPSAARVGPPPPPAATRPQSPGIQPPRAAAQLKRAVPPAPPLARRPAAVIQRVTKNEFEEKGYFDEYKVWNSGVFKKWLWEGGRAPKSKVFEGWAKDRSLEEALELVKEYKLTHTATTTTTTTPMMTPTPSPSSSSSSPPPRRDFLGKGATDFEKRFIIEFGDLVYGRREARVPYKDWLASHYGYGKETDHPRWMTIDQYNNISDIRNLAPQSELTKNIENSTAERGQKDYAHSYVGALYRGRYAPHDDKHYRQLGPEQFEKVATKEGQPPKQTEQSVVASVTTWQALRRSSKHALTTLPESIENWRARIHFTLDDYTEEDMRKVVEKRLHTSGDMDKTSSIPITTSELRALYRRWDDVGYRTYFYREGMLVNAPWQDKPGAWDEYGRQRYKKYLGRVAERLPRDTEPPINVAVQLGMAKEEASRGQPNQGAERLKRLLSQL